MNLLVALILIFAFILLYIFIIEIFSVLFTASGLTREKARYQTISLFTNAGFTTSLNTVAILLLKHEIEVPE